MRKTVLFVLALCCLSVNAWAFYEHRPYVPFTGGFDAGNVTQAAFPLVAIWEIVSSPGFINLALLVVALFVKKDSSNARIRAIVTIGYGIVDHLIASGQKDWRLLVNLGVKYLVDEINARSDIKSMSEREVEEVQKSLVSYARRKLLVHPVEK